MRDFNNGTFVVQFSATWCMPCKTQSKLFENALDVVKIDIDDEPELASKYNVKSIPRTLVIKDGVVIETFVGITKPDKIKELL